jgi:signal transduction histidine kinase
VIHRGFARAPHTLRARLMRASLLTTLVALLLSAGLLFAYEFRSYREERAADLRAQAELVAHTTGPALLFNDPASAQQQLSSLWQNRQLQMAVIYGAAGKVFAHYKAGTLRDEVPPAQIPMPEPGTRYSGALLEVSQAVSHEGEKIGMVYLRAGHDLAGRLQDYATILAVVTALSLGLALGVFGRLQRVITRPLGEVTRVAEQVMAQRDWSLRAPLTDSGDIAVLVDAFNRMLAEVQQRTGELEHEMAERRRAEAELREADHRKDVFLATLAHELRNPLAPMSSAVSLLRRPQAQPAVHARSLDILERQLRHMVRLIDDLLDVSRITTGKLALHREPVDLTAVVRAAIELIEPVARDKGLALQASLPALPCLLLGDGARLLQVVSNLLTNACRYTGPGGRVEVVLECAEQAPQPQARIRVRDTGIGVEAGMQRRIFELFEQVDKSLERGNAGLGIGLTLARQLVQLHGGEIELYSAGLGQGSTFTVSLPLPPPLVQDAAAIASGPAFERGPV